MIALIIALLLGLLGYLLTLGVAPISAITGFITSIVNWNASQNLPNASSGLSPATSQTALTKKSLYSATGAAVANAINQGQSRVYSIGASSSASIDLTAAFTNLVNNPTATFARLKAIRVWLLSAADDATNGTAATSVTIGNSGANDFISQAANRGWLGSAASTFDLANGQEITWSTDNANGVVIDGTHKIFKITNNDAGIAAAVQVDFLGADA